jgi:hypothetical protein
VRSHAPGPLDLRSFEGLTSPLLQQVGQSFEQVCDNLLQARDSLKDQQLAAILPDYLAPAADAKSYLRVRGAGVDSRVFGFRLAWNPRLLRLNPHAVRGKDFLTESLTRQMRER